eukprot:2067074-Rhodomonas_salina.1
MTSRLVTSQSVLYVFLPAPIVRSVSPPHVATMFKASEVVHAWIANRGAAICPTSCHAAPAGALHRSSARTCLKLST